MEEYPELETSELVDAICSKCEHEFQISPVKLAKCKDGKILCGKCIIFEKKLKGATKRHGFRFGV